MWIAARESSDAGTVPVGARDGAKMSRGGVMTRARLVLALIAVIVASTVFGGVAAAVGTAKAEKVSACTSHKHVRVMGKKVTCHPGEKRLSWRIKSEPGPAGPRGPAGPSGRVGNVRTDWVTGLLPMTNPSVGAVTTAEAYCQSGEQAVGGGYKFVNESQLDVVQESNPVVLGPLQGWHVKIAAMPPLGGVHNVRAYVMCAKT
jgi:hypothetical protein